MRRINLPLEKTLFFLGVFLYVLILRALDLTCAIRAVLKIPCPGCGLTRATLAVFSLDFSQAFAYHPLWFFVPLIFLYILFDGNLFGKTIDRIIIGVLIIFFLFVWIMRLIGVLPCL